MSGALAPDVSGRDLLTGPGCDRSRLARAMADTFSLSPDAIGDADDPKDWHFIQTEGWAALRRNNAGVTTSLRGGGRIERH